MKSVFYLFIFFTPYCPAPPTVSGVMWDQSRAARPETYHSWWWRERQRTGRVSHSTLLFVRRLNQCVITVDGYHKKQWQEPSQGYPPNCVIYKYEMAVNAAATMDGRRVWWTWYISNLRCEIRADRSMRLRAFLTVANNADNKGSCLDLRLSGKTDKSPEFIRPALTPRCFQGCSVILS